MNAPSWKKARIQGDEGAIHDLGVAAQLRFEQSRILTERLRQILKFDPGIFGRRGESDSASAGR